MGDEEMNDNFFGFSPESFEQFARAIAMAVLGPNLIGFGDGPDGGREAMFEGKVSYRDKGSEDWDGYGVIQAKYKTKTEGTTRNQNWVLDSLNRELKLFCTSEKRNPKPNYYLLITNVELSSANEGGKAKIDKVFESYSDRLPLRGWAVWDANQLRTYLPSYPEIRNNFLQFFTVGDFLAKVLERLNLKSRNLHDVLTTYLIRELRHDICARLDQTGNKTETQVPLQKLFFDIPAAKEPTSTAPEEKLDQSGKLPKGVLHEILKDASRKLDPMTIQYEAKTSDGIMRFPARYVLQGGPGSGKSTLGQFLAQIHRAALLDRVRPHLLAPNIVELINQVRQACTDQDLYWPTAPRYPFRIELIQFAKALASRVDGINSFAGYLLRSIRGDHSMDHEALVAFFGSQASLLILDGLDEVPHTSNRVEVIQTIKDFLDELRVQNADVFLVASTRVQGYQDEFAEDCVAVRFLTPLSRARALKYVRTYASVRYNAVHPENTDRIVKEIEETATQSLTDQLLSTPLQATFLITVIAAKGSPGSNRWSLFKSYYDTIYDRELQKAVPSCSNVLRDHQQLVFRLHQIVGFWLQYLGESNPSGATNLAENVFRRVVDRLLTEKKYVGDELKQCSESLVYAARERLIFLTSRVAGELAFEVRSLQEFMAAECLMTGESRLIPQRLKEISGCFYWRNTIIFAANKCYTDSSAEQFIDTICRLPELLNTEAIGYGVAFQPGAELALDLVHSGAAESDPRSTRSLTALALQRIDCDDVFFGGMISGERILSRRGLYNERLAAVHSERTKDLFVDRIRAAFSMRSFRGASEAWALLARLKAYRVSWAEASVLIKLKEREGLVGFRLYESIPRDLATEMQNDLAKNLLKLSPNDLQSCIPLFGMSEHELSGGLRTIMQFFRGGDFNRKSLDLVGHLGNLPNLEFVFKIVKSDDAFGKNLSEFITQSADCHDAWTPLKNSIEFLETPNLPNLIIALQRIASGASFGKIDPVLSRCLPWPIAVCLNTAKSKEDLLAIVRRLIDISKYRQPDFRELDIRLEKHLIDLQTVSDSNDQLNWLMQEDGGVFYPADVAFRIDFRLKHIHPMFIWPYAEKAEKGIFRSCSEIISAVKSVGLRHLIAKWFLEHRSAFIDLQEFGLCVQAVSTGTCISFGRADLGPPDKLAEWIPICADMGSRDVVFTDFWFPPLPLINLLQDEFTGANSVVSGEASSISSCQLGVLMFLANCSWIGFKSFDIPSNLLSFERFSTLRHQFGALLVRLAQRDLQVPEVGAATAVVRRVLLEGSRETYVRRLCGVLDFHFVDNKAFLTFVGEVARLITDTDPMAAEWCEDLMRRIVERRLSGLHDTEALRRLWLPDVANLQQLRSAESS